MTESVLRQDALRKARGAFFTPAAVSDFLACWAVRSPLDRVLEPSCGEAAILAAAGRRLKGLGSAEPMVGYELHAQSASQAEMHLLSEGLPCTVIRGDFLRADPQPVFDAILGNPPYVRYQGFSGEARAAGLTAALAQGVRLTHLASSWAPFVIHASAFLKPSGRLALVLPAELLSSNYAAEVRAFLARRFAQISVVLIDKQVFPGVLTEALLLLAEGSGGTNRIRFGRVQSTSVLDQVSFGLPVRLDDPAAKWTSGLVADHAIGALSELGQAGGFGPLGDWGRIALGAVTGNNAFFAMTPAEAHGLDLADQDLVRISPPGSRHLRHLTMTSSDHELLGRAGSRTLLFRPQRAQGSALRYIREGESRGVHLAYKCRVRNPWWKVPLAQAPDAFFTYMNTHLPQLAANPSRLHHVNSVHGLYVNSANASVVDLLPLAAVNTATALSAEIVGRAYGGGVLKMEPREAVRLLVPSPAAIEELRKPLSELLPHARRDLAAGRLDDVLQAVDRILLSGLMGWPIGELSAVRSAYRNVSLRRRTRVRAVT